MMKLILATRKSPLALAQAEMAAAHLRTALGAEVQLLKMTTTGDRQAAWSLERQGGKGLFTTELEQALLQGEADAAVHSTKDLPGMMTAGLVIAGYLPRADARDVLVMRVDVAAPRQLATGSPRRRMQAASLFPGAEFREIRGNVDTRLRKIADQGLAEGTILAAAGLRRLGIAAWPGLRFEPLDFDRMVPAVGQGAVALQCRSADGARFSASLDASTARAVTLERALQTALGGGCQTAFGAHAVGDILHLFHEDCGVRKIDVSEEDYAAPERAAARILKELNLA